MPLRIERTTVDSPEARALIEALNAELSATYPEPGATHFRLDPDEVAPGRGAFLIARRDGEAVGCGAVRRIDATTAELKRMFTVPRARGTGVASAILAALEAEARALGATRVVLETGTRQLEAMALYERRGYVRIPFYGEYDGPLSLCMERRL